MIKSTQPVPPVVMEMITDPAVLEKMRAQREKAKRNWAWYEGHVAEIYAKHRGKCICVAVGELFVGDTPKDVLIMAQAAHPDDDGRFLHYVPKQPRLHI